jgi:hypothetical protein
MRSVVKPSVVLCGALLALGIILASAPQPALAANAGAPYTNVDPSNDRGNDTGDSKVEGLNKTQSDQNYWSDAQRRGGVPNPPYYVPQGAPR